jgi:MFS transporter, ACS family, hexuronate transporter
VSGSDESAARTGSPLRWAIVSLLFLGTVINYIDRQTVSTLAPVLSHDLHLSNFDYGRIGFWFLIIYSLTMWLWGAVFDRIGNRVGYSLAIGWWSFAEMGHALAGGFGSLCVARGVLGAGESGNWPGVTRTLAAWFVEKQRALAMGIVNAGAGFGSAVATPLIVCLQLAFGWRVVFVVTGLLGLVLVAAWLSVYPGMKRGMAGTGAAAERSSAVPWKALLVRREVWGIILGRFFGDPIWWLFLNWLPKYLFDVHGFSLQRIGYLAWLPYAAAVVGGLCGGQLSGSLIGRGWSVNAARKTALAAGTALMLVGMATPFVHSPYAALACMSVTCFGFQFWAANALTLPSDFFPVGAVGSVAGFAGTAAGLGGALFNLSIGWIVDRFSYIPVFLIEGGLAVSATSLLFIVAGRIRRIEDFA